MARFVLHTPSAQSVSVKGCKATITWSQDFGRVRTEKFDAAQRFVDAEMLRRSGPRMPFRDGFLEKSGTLMTEIGSGELQYGGPYAARLYYNPQYNFDTAKHASAGGEWFELTKIAEKEDILRGTAEKAGAKK